MLALCFFKHSTLGAVKNINILIKRAIRGDSVQEEALVKLCIDIAEAYLRTKINKHSFLINLAAPSLRDFAIDCIAELFERKEHKLIVFQKWISEDELQHGADSKLFIQIRRLVFSKVNDHIFGTYKDYDPSLSKIIRNIKRVLKENGIQDLEISSNGKYVCLESPHNSAPDIPIEILRIKFSTRCSEVSSTVEALEQLRFVFEMMEDEYNCRVHITAFALILRQFYTALQDDEVSSFESVELEYLNGELNEILKEAVEKTRNDLHSNYVIKNKINEGDYFGYFYAVQVILESEYKETVHSGKSYYDQFVLYFEHITNEEYRNNHRKYLEYFVKLTKQRFLKIIKNENNSAKKIF